MPPKKTIQPERIYFTVGEAASMIGCTAGWVHYWSAKLGLPVRAAKGQHRRLKMVEINQLKDELHRHTQARQLPASAPGQGSGPLEAQTNAVPESQNRPELR